MYVEPWFNWQFGRHMKKLATLFLLIFFANTLYGNSLFMLSIEIGFFKQLKFPFTPLSQSSVLRIWEIYILFSCATPVPFSWSEQERTRVRIVCNQEILSFYWEQHEIFRAWYQFKKPFLGSFNLIPRRDS